MMVVKAQYRGSRIASLYIGASNVRRFFTKRISMIELQLDHLRILCGLNPQFWLDKPEIQDSRLSLWLESKYLLTDRSHREVSLALIPTGKNSFRLTAVTQDIPVPLTVYSPLTQSTVKSAQSQLA
jgi:hypothetical protein